jgi:pyrroline-5-carboxylate reductase
MRVGLIGAGNMARAMARGWGDPVLCSDGGSGRAQDLVDELGGEVGTNLEVAENAKLVVLCHKPYQLAEVAGEIAGTAKAVASVLGGVTTAQLQDAYPDTPVFAVMPNTAVEVQRGVVCLAVPGGPPNAHPDMLGRVVELFGRLGSVLAIPEAQMGPATALMGVGPAYQALLAEAQIDAGVRHGLKPALAGKLVTQTMAGSAALIEHRKFDTLSVRREVTSPGGSTARGLAALEAAGIRSAFNDAIDAVVLGGSGGQR